ncbi:MAG TPA: MoxR family ATPase, partial [Actinomycetota bacterium]
MGGLPFGSVEELTDALATERYLADRGLATGIYLAVSLDKPLLLEGEAGVGKTEVAKVLASLLGRELIRLQCYEGIDASQALYEWNYSRQLIAVRAMQDVTAE